METEHTTPTDKHLRVLKDATILSRREPAIFAGGSAYLESFCSLRGSLAHRRSMLRDYVRGVRADGGDPRTNAVVQAVLRDLACLRALNPADAFCHAIRRSIELFKHVRPTMDHECAEAVLLVGVFHYDDDHDPNPALPACLNLPTREVVSERGVEVTAFVRQLSRFQFPTRLLPLIIPAWIRIDGAALAKRATSAVGPSPGLTAAPGARTSSDGSGDQPWRSVPAEGLLRGWKEILGAIRIQYSRGSRDWARRENDRSAGPIHHVGNTVQAYRTQVEAWIQSIECRAEASQHRKQAIEHLGKDHVAELSALGMARKKRRGYAPKAGDRRNGGWA